MSLHHPPNFLTCPIDGEPPSPGQAPLLPLVRPPKRRRRWGLWIVVLLFLVGGFVVSPLVYGGMRAGLAAQRMKNHLEEAQTALLAQDAAKAAELLEAAEADAGGIRDGLRATGAWRYAPWIGSQLRIFEELGRGGEEALSGARGVVLAVASVQEIFQEIQEAHGSVELGVAGTRSFQDFSREEKRAILSRVNAALPEIRLAREKITIANDTWQSIPQDALYTPIRLAIQPLIATMAELKLRMDQTVSLGEVFLPMAGYPTPKRYLVLLQNADEMRATGGFIGTMGVIEVDAGDFRKLEFQDVYSFDAFLVRGGWKEQPPEPIKRELGTPAWYLRDSNWSPDFPQSADRVMRLYGEAMKFAGTPSVAHADGVIGIEPEFFTKLLRLTGPITVQTPGYAPNTTLTKTFTPENFYTQLEYAVEIEFLNQGIPVHQRKDVLIKVGQELIAKVMTLPANQWPDLLDIVTESFARKDMMVAVKDKSLQKLLDDRHWSNRAQGAEQDYLWVIDSNLAALKTDGVMDKEISYALDVRNPAEPLATVTLRYHNTNTKIDWRYTRYRDYVRVYVPEGSELVSSEGAMLSDKTKTGGRVVPGTVDVYRELGKTVFGAFWAIEPGETRTLRFTYRLPPSAVSALNQNAYQLFVQKQPGTHTRLTLDLSFGKNLVSAVPGEERKEFGDARYRSTFRIESDTSINVKL